MKLTQIVESPKAQYIKLGSDKYGGVRKYFYELVNGIPSFHGIDISNMDLVEIPKEFQELGEYHVGAHFHCANNKLTSIKGAPTVVGDNFNCGHNRLTSLEGGPRTVGGAYVCTGNLLKTLKGCSTSVGTLFECSHNTLTSLEGAPITVGGQFQCGSNDLRTLKGAPRVVKNFHCNLNELMTLNGGPDTVNGSFNCEDNYLRSLEGAPSYVRLGIKAFHNRFDPHSVIELLGTIDINGVQGFGPTVDRIITKHMRLIRSGEERPALARANAAEELYDLDLDDYV